MEDLNLTETKLRYFGDLFLCCDEESNGKIPILKATELFRSSNISNEALNKIMELCIPTNTSIGLSHINRKQFYSALKLIAAHQANLPLTLESLSTSADLPLPRFTWALNSGNTSDLIQLSNSPKEQHIPKRERVFNSHGAYEPMRVSCNSSDSELPPGLSHDNVESHSTDSEIESETVSQRSDAHGLRIKNGSPWSTASESPTPTNSVAESRSSQNPVWENTATGRGVWPTNVTEEHTQLLGTEEESSDRHSSEEEGGEGEVMWAPSAEQHRHYARQFAQLQPDDRGLLPVHLAMKFFEKSRLPLSDLRKIWVLVDTVKDGSLTLEEFSVAMHLVVLRRRDIPVPDLLPACFVPPLAIRRESSQAVTTDLVDLGSDMFSSGTSADFNLVPKVSTHIDAFDGVKPIKRTTGIEESPHSLSPQENKSEQPGNREWTKFVDSPTSSVSSPGPKPVNFDFQKAAVEKDPKIFHPVALRVTPDAGTIAPAQPPEVSESQNGASPRRIDDHTFSSERLTDGSSPKKLNSQMFTGETNTVADIKPIQRPQPKKPLKTIGVLPPPPAKEVAVTEEVNTGPASLQYAPKKEPPPPPPPRPQQRSHARSSSLDLNRFKSVPPPPHPPPRISPSAIHPKKLMNQRSEGDVLGLATEPSNSAPSESFADFARFESSDGANMLHGLPVAEDDDLEGPPKRHGAFQVYRKPTPRRSTSPACDREEDSLKRLQEENILLHRLCRELSLELADVSRERESLRQRLEAGNTSTTTTTTV